MLDFSQLFKVNIISIFSYGEIGAEQGKWRFQFIADKGQHGRKSTTTGQQSPRAFQWPESQIPVAFPGNS